MILAVVLQFWSGDRDVSRRPNPVEVNRLTVQPGGSSRCVTDQYHS